MTEPVTTACAPGTINSCNLNELAFFNHVYSNYKKAVMAEIRKWTMDPDLLKDLCQEIFLKVWNNISRYDSAKGELYTWLLQITRNHCTDYLRSKYSRTQKLTQRYGAEREETHGGSMPGLENLYMQELVVRLPLEQREIVELLFVEGYSQTGVAKIKKIPLGTVKSRSRAAIKQLRAFLSAPVLY